MNKPRGFTLIELLISVMIIGVLTALILVVINPAKLRSKARDAQRIQDVKAIQSALEVYYADNNVYPSSGAVSCPANPSGWERIGTGVSCIWSTLVGPGRYQTTLNVDPINDSVDTSPCRNTDPGYRYNYIAYDNAYDGGDARNDRKAYVVTAILENNTVYKDHSCTTTDIPNWNWADNVCGGSGVAVSNCYAVQNP